MATVETTAGTATNGSAPAIVALGYTAASFSTAPVAAGFTSSISDQDQVAKFEAVPPVPGSTLIGWGFDDAELDDPGVGSASADFVAVLADDTNTIVSSVSWSVTSDIFDYGSPFPTRSPGLELRTDGNDTVNGSADLLLDGTDDGVGYHIEILAFAFTSATPATFTLDRAFLRWTTPDDAWVVGKVSFPGSSTGFS
jgi:hypothetical protein